MHMAVCLQVWRTVIKGKSRNLLRKRKVVERGFLGCPGQDTELSFLKRSLCCYAKERGYLLLWLCWENSASWHDFDTSPPKRWEKGSKQVVQVEKRRMRLWSGEHALEACTRSAFKLNKSIRESNVRNREGEKERMEKLCTKDEESGAALKPRNLRAALPGARGWETIEDGDGAVVLRGIPNLLPCTHRSASSSALQIPPALLQMGTGGPASPTAGVGIQQQAQSPEVPEE